MAFEGVLLQETSVTAVLHILKPSILLVGYQRVASNTELIISCHCNALVELEATNAVYKAE
jgi:hypothetical protein